jgi:ribose transport system substrate-binding protein
MRGSIGRLGLGAAASIAFAAAVLAGGGCAEKTAGGARIVFITNGTSPFWDAAEKGWNDKARELGVSAQFLRNNGGDAPGQIALLDQVASRGDVVGLAVSVVDVNAVGLVERLKEIGKRIPVVTVDSDVKPEDRGVRRAYIGTNNLQAGKVAGRIAAQLLPEGGRWIGFVGNKHADNARMRIEGFQQAAGAAFQEVDVMQDDHDPNKAKQNVASSLSKDVQLMFGIYSYNAPAIAEVVAESGRRPQIKIVAFDAEANTVLAVQAGQIDATIVQNTYDMGALCARLLHALANGDQAVVDAMLDGRDEIDTGVRVVVPDDSPLVDESVQKIGEFKKYMASQGLRST